MGKINRIVKPRRKRGRQYKTTTVTVPPWMITAVIDRAAEDFFGNRSALWQAAMSAYLGISDPASQPQTQTEK